MKFVPILASLFAGLPACAAEGDDAAAALTALLGEGNSEQKQKVAGFDDDFSPEVDSFAPADDQKQGAAAKNASVASTVDDLSSLLPSGDLPAEEPAPKATKAVALGDLWAQLAAKDKELSEQRARADKLQSEVETLQEEETDSKAAPATDSKAADATTELQNAREEVKKLRQELVGEKGENHKLQAALDKIRTALADTGGSAAGGETVAAAPAAPVAKKVDDAAAPPKLAAAAKPVVPQPAAPKVTKPAKAVKAANTTTGSIQRPALRVHAVKAAPAAAAEKKAVAPPAASAAKKAQQQEKLWAPLPGSNTPKPQAAVRHAKLRGQQAAAAPVVAAPKADKAAASVAKTAPQAAEKVKPAEKVAKKADVLGDAMALGVDAADDDTEAPGFATLEKKLQQEESRVDDLDQDTAEEGAAIAASAVKKATAPAKPQQQAAAAVAVAPANVATAKPQTPEGNPSEPPHSSGASSERPPNAPEATAAVAAASSVAATAADATNVDASNSDFKALEVRLKEEDEKISELDGDGDADMATAGVEAAEESGRSTRAEGGDISNATAALGKEADSDAEFLAQFERTNLQPQPLI
eukprot:TRINITY_DN2805_c0_g1_i1.p1 TRINITY_DN2805_c0_g1~~TRINITY_DN2805_c0_g1_i1.p1  ORF type:complete len:586 (-),score=254.43 TRINITY_DN2805_c0_g1_i1:25-1782(-)